MSEKDFKIFTVEDLETDKKHQYNAYRALGYNESQALTLAYCVFRDWRNKYFVATMLKEYKKHGREPFSEYFIKNVYRIEELANTDKVRDEVDKSERSVIESFLGMFNQSGNVRGSVAKTKTVSYNYSSVPRELRTFEAGNTGYSPNLMPQAMNCVSVDCETKEGFFGPTPEFPTSPDVPDTESYEHITESGFQDVSKSPTSSFNTTCNTASIGMIMNRIRHGVAVRPDSVRLEELMNYFDYDINSNDNEMFDIDIEICDKPNSDNKLMFVALKGKKLEPKGQNIVLLLDTSGSMGHNDFMMKYTVMTTLSKMKDGDVLSLITYSSQDHTILDGFKFKKQDIDEVIRLMLTIEITGCTNGSAGIETAYKIAKKNFIKDGINRVVLITDGDLNFGINSKDGLEKLILEKKKTNVFLSVIGMGIGNYKDDKLEVLAKNGNGNYCVVNEMYEAETNINKRYDEMMNILAKDVKASVEFNPTKVKAFRLLGYENRGISLTDFHNDKKISEPFGSGAHCVAMYELVMANGEDNTQSGLKYQQSVPVESDEICTVSVRYKMPLEDESVLISKPARVIGQMTDNLKLAFCCAIVGGGFRGSEFVDLKDKLLTRYLAETFENGKVKDLNGDKLEILKFLAKSL